MRFHGFDALRVAGMLAVIYIHASDTNDVVEWGMRYLGFAVPCFLMMSAFLAQQTILRKNIAPIDWITRKFKRLAPSYFAWTAIYLAVRFAKSMATGEQLESGILGSIFWGDASHQLYFVPFLFYSFVLWTGLMRLARRRPVTTAGLLAVSTVIFVWQASAIEASLPANRWFIGKNMAWFPIGMLFAIVVEQLREKREWFFWPILALLVVMLLSDFLNVYAISTVVFALAIAAQRPAPDWLKHLSIYSFGVYLSHVLFIEGMQFIAPRLGLNLQSISVTLGIMVIAGLFSYATCMLLGQSKWSRWSVT
ncbi:acyltransferase [Stieleria sp. ICT_E10.1]|uniref:acyltransferase n=1 Tax=Stieleria sedimenti TaxID=2976331 RepID=UPI00217F482C|nr:acyltransferase [Stieleria sedimenti]MCS7469435.1 acyltransferase [Stieleria sedimenti]